MYPAVAILPVGCWEFHIRPLFLGAHMSTSAVETFVRNAKEQVTQSDINNSILKAIAELSREAKRLEDEIHRVRREVQISRRF
jgi:hypothetical protein